MNTGSSLRLTACPPAAGPPSVSGATMVGRGKPNGSMNPRTTRRLRSRPENTRYAEPGAAGSKARVGSEIPEIGPVVPSTYRHGKSGLSVRR
ncbi:MAG TPA: hypothetical protein VKP11_07120 [Frankiaceae bacterium]|nr:hypothetical protein [Frankiaceae bacterium]